MAQYVQALKAFDYDRKVGRVERGQVFKMGGHVNDAGLLRHRLVVPFTGAVGKLPTDSRGRRFVDDGSRQRAGDTEQTPAESLSDRRAKIAERVVKVGA